MTIEQTLLKQFDYCYDKNGWFVGDSEAAKARARSAERSGTQA